MTTTCSFRNWVETAFERLLSKPEGAISAASLPALIFLAVAFISFQGIAMAQGGNMVNGENHRGTLTTAGQIDTWTFQAAKNDAISLSIGEVFVGEKDPAFYPAIQLRGPDAALLGSSYGTNVAQVHVKAPLTGLYTVQVSNYDNRQSALANYVLTLAKSPGSFIVPAGDEGGPMTNGANHTGVIRMGDLDQWSFQAAKGDTYSISAGEVLVGEVDPGFYPYIWLRGPDGTELAYNYGANVAQIHGKAALTGTYTVVVSTYDSGQDAVGNYVITLAKSPGDFIVPAGDEGGPMTNGANHAGVIRVGDLDQWSFQAAKDDSFSISIGEVFVGEVDPGFYPYIWLRGPDGTDLAYNYGANVAQIHGVAALTGTYTVVVSTYDSGQDAVGNYLITLAKSPGAFIVPQGDEGGQLTNGINHSGSIHIGDLDQWSFFAAKDDAIAIRVSEVQVGEKDSGFYPYIWLRGPDGAQLNYSYGDLSAQISMKAPLTGTYTVVVSTYDSGQDATGSYLISTANVGPGQLRYTVQDRGGQSLTSPGAASGAITVGYGRIDPDGGSLNPTGLAIFGFRQNNILVSEAAVPASSLISSGRIYAEVAGAVNTGLAIANPNGRAVTIAFYFTDANGQNFGSGSTTIGSGGQMAKFLNEAPFNSGNGVNGTFTFTATLPVSVVALRGLTNERSEFLITTLPVSDLLETSTTESILFPHFADGGGWTTQIVMVNPTDDVMTGNVQFYSPGNTTSAGQPVALTIGGQTTNTFAYSIPARSSRALRTAGVGSAIQVGSVRVIPSGSSKTPSGVGIFNFRNVSEAGVPALRTGKAFRLFAESFGDFNGAAIGSQQTGVAVANSASTVATVNFELYTLSGSSTGLTGTITVPANGQAAMFLSQIPGMTTLPSSFQGVLRVSSSESISVVGLRGRNNERRDFLITTTSPVNEASAPQSGLLFFPHIADGGGYTTQFVLFSGQSYQFSGGLRLLSQSGVALNWTLH